MRLLKDSWLPLRMVTLLVFLAMCGIMVYFAWDLKNTFRLWVNAGLLAGALGFGLMGIFLRPSRKEGKRLSYLSNRSFGLVSVGLVIAVIVRNPYDFFALTQDLDWQNYMLILSLILLQAVLIILILSLILLQAVLILVYLELLWALASFQEEPYPGEEGKAHKLRLINQLHYLLFLPALLFFCGVFIELISVFTTFFVLTSRMAFLRSLSSGSVYPFFIVGMICLAVLVVLLGIMYIWYRFVRTEPELFYEEEEKIVDFKA